MIMWKRNTSF